VADFRQVNKVLKVNEEMRIVKAPVLRPGIEDRQGTIISKEVVEAAFYDFAERLFAEPGEGQSGLKVMHAGEHDDGVFHKGMVPVEFYLTEDDKTYSVAQVDGEDAELFCPAGTWMMATKIYGDEEWESVKKGHFRGYSIGGVADKESIADEEAA